MISEQDSSASDNSPIYIGMLTNCSAIDNLDFHAEVVKVVGDYGIIDNVNINTANGLKGTDYDFGLEAVLVAQYAYTEDVTFKLVGSYFAPGDAFDDATFLKAEVKVCF